MANLAKPHHFAALITSLLVLTKNKKFNDVFVCIMVYLFLECYTNTTYIPNKLNTKRNN